MPEGTINTIRPNRDDGRGFGLITPDGGAPDLIFYSRSVAGTVGAVGRFMHSLRHAAPPLVPPFDQLRVGQRVRFFVGEDGSQAGRACAERVRPSAGGAATARSGKSAIIAPQGPK